MRPRAEGIDTSRPALRVLHLTTEFPPVIGGGMGVAVGGLARASARAGVATDVLLVRDHGGAGYGQTIFPGGRTFFRSDAANCAGLTLYKVGWHAMEQSGVDVARRLRPDVVHLHPVELWPVARAIQQQLGIPVVYTVHSLNVAEYEVGHELNCMPLWQAQQEVIRSADRVIALTENEDALLMACCPASCAKVRVIGNGIDDCAQARRATRRTRRTRRGPPLVLFAGRFVDRKGIHDLLAAIPRVLEEVPDVRFVLIGGYGSGPDIERTWLTEALQPYRNRIHFTGWLEPARVMEWYSVADIMVIPSWYEPFGLVVLEGMLHGMSIAASNVGGPAAILEDGRTGILIPPKDADAIARCIVRLARDPGRCRRLGAAAARQVRRHWLWPSVFGRISALYQEVVSGRASP